MLTGQPFRGGGRKAHSEISLIPQAPLILCARREKAQALVLVAAQEGHSAVLAVGSVEVSKPTYKPNLLDRIVLTGKGKLISVRMFLRAIRARLKDAETGGSPLSGRLFR